MEGCVDGEIIPGKHTILGPSTGNFGIGVSYITNLMKYDAIVMAFLPGTEGEGIADVLFGDYDFTGTLPMTWVKNFEKVDEKHELPESEILFPYGYGLNKAGEKLVRE